jgi:hypothetical protein
MNPVVVMCLVLASAQAKEKAKEEEEARKGAALPPCGACTNLGTRQKARQI